MRYESKMMAEIVNMRGYEDDLIDAYFARPLGDGPYPGVVVVHHMPGWDNPTKEIVRRFAYHGYCAISPNLHFREGKGSFRKNAQSVMEAGGPIDAMAMGDVQGGVEYLRTLPYLNGKVGIIGYCSGGRQVYLAACTVPGVDAAVDCYGGGVIMPPERINPRQPVAPIDCTKDLQCPLLGLFGKEDKSPSPEDVSKIEEELKKFGKTYEFHSYDNTGHAFFMVDSGLYRPEAAVDGWSRIFKWFDQYLY